MGAEGQLQKLILDWLQAKQILAFRMNTGAVKLEKRFVKFGVQGMADILAFFQYTKFIDDDEWGPFSEPVWIEVKSNRGQQTEFQRSFQKQVEAAGHRYILAKSLDDVIEAME